MSSYDWFLEVGAMRYAQMTKAAPTATRQNAVSSARGSLGLSGRLVGLSAGLLSRRSRESGMRDWLTVSLLER
jgi:allantoicase